LSVEHIAAGASPLTDDPFEPGGDGLDQFLLPLPRPCALQLAFSSWPTRLMSFSSTIASC